MTLAERLRGLAKLLELTILVDSEEELTAWVNIRTNLLAMADYVDGRVVAGVKTSKVLPDPRLPHITWRCELQCRYEWGSTELDAIANQQQYADERDGRVIP